MIPSLRGRTRATAEAVEWAAVVLVRSLGQAKSRLRLPAQLRAGLAFAMAADTIDAVRASEAVFDAVVVSPDRVVAEHAYGLGIRVIHDEPLGDLNSASRHAARTLRRLGVRRVALLPADLPALTGETLTLALQRAATVRRAVVPDAAGTGTVLLGATPGALRPRWGFGSYDRHVAAGARPLELDGLERLRRDVDTLEDLRGPLRFGVGARTTDVLMEAGLDDAGEKALNRAEWGDQRAC